MGLYEQNGIAISNLAPKVGEKVEIVYNGLLKESGARNVKLHLGYNEKWEDSQYIEMNLSDNIFMATIPLKREGILNFAFTDPVGNWDNNSGANYSVRIAGMRAGADTPMTGPYEKKPAAKRSAKAGASEKTNEETAPPVKRTRAAASKTADTTGKKASPPSPATPQDTGMSRGRVKGEARPIMPEETTGTRRGPGRKKKEP